MSDLRKLFKGLLIAVIVFGVTANGAQSWIEIWGFNIQPSEIAKI